MLASLPKPVTVPLILGKVPAGFPSPAADYEEIALDPTKLIIEDEAATFMVRVSGDSLSGEGIRDNDILVVNRAIEPRSGHIVVAGINGEFTAKIFTRRNNRAYLLAANPDYPPIEITEEADFIVFGVVRWVLRDLTER